MDLLTQAALGASVGHWVLRDTERRGALWGAVLGVLPDVDAALAPLLSDVQALSWHRSVTHSLLACGVLPWVLGVGLGRRCPDVGAWRWGVLVAWVWGTHVALDVLTTFGTQVGWPFTRAPVAWGWVTVIDPGVTLPLLLGLGVARWGPERARRWASLVGVGVAALYLGWAGVAKRQVEGVFGETLAARGIAPTRVLSKPTLFNTVLWRLVAEVEDGYWEGYRSVCDAEATVRLRWIPREGERLERWADAPEVRRLLEVLDGYYAVRQAEELEVVDVRYGEFAAWSTEETPYVFRYAVREGADGVEVVALPRAFRLTPALRRAYVDRLRGR